MVNFRKDLFFQDQIFIRLVFADASLDIFLVVKFLRMAKFSHFCVDFMFAAAKYVFLTCIVPVVETEGSVAMFPKLNLINQCELQFLTIKQQNCSFVSFVSQLTFGLLNPYCNSLVYLAVLILEIIPKKIASQLFSIGLLENTHACNAQKRCG